MQQPYSTSSVLLPLYTSANLPWKEGSFCCVHTQGSNLWIKRYPSFPLTFRPGLGVMHNWDMLKPFETVKVSLYITHIKYTVIIRR